MKYEPSTKFHTYSNITSTIKVGIEILVIPDTIDGREVSTVYFHDNIGFDTAPIIEGIKKIVYPSSLKVLGSGNRWFGGYAGGSGRKNGDCIFCELEEVVLPEGLHTIKDWAFGLDVMLKSITIPSSVRVVEGVPFYGCSGDLKVYINGPKAVTENWGTSWTCLAWGYDGPPMFLTVEYLGE